MNAVVIYSLTLISLLHSRLTALLIFHQDSLDVRVDQIFMFLPLVIEFYYFYSFLSTDKHSSFSCLLMLMHILFIDNTLNHGPGGQGEYAIPSEADPCFAKVIQGFEAVNRMARMPVETGSFRAMKENVGIVYARLLKPSVSNA